MTPKQSVAYAAVKAADKGLNIDEIAQVLNVTKVTAQTYMTHLGQTGLVVHVLASTRTVWCTPEREAAIRESIRQAVREKKRAAKRKWNKANPTRDRCMLGIGDGGAPIVQRRVPAAQAAPIVTRAAASVWEWGR